MLLGTDTNTPGVLSLNKPATNAPPKKKKKKSEQPLEQP